MGIVTRGQGFLKGLFVASSDKAVWLGQPCDRSRVRLYLTDDGFVSFKSARGNVSRPAIVFSLPKAGTYLVAKMLLEIGLVDLEVHLSLDVYSDYRFRSNVEKFARVRELSVELPIEVSARLIRPGQFAVGHIPCGSRTQELFADFTKLMVVRDVRDSLVSMMRFHYRRQVADPMWMPAQRGWLARPEGPSRMLGFLDTFGADLMTDARRVQPWLEGGRADLVLRFEQLIGDLGAEAQQSAVEQLAKTVGAGRADAVRVLQASIGAETLTYSGQRTDRSGFWNADVEEKFVEIGGRGVSEALGYGS